jgi:hypothetical protein
MTSIYNTCSNEHGGDMELVVQCVAAWVETVTSQAVNATTTTQSQSEPVIPLGKYVEAAELNRWLLVLAGAMVFFMQVRTTTSVACHLNETVVRGCLRVQTTRHEYLVRLCHPPLNQLFVARSIDRRGSPWFVPVRFERRT